MSLPGWISVDDGLPPYGAPVLIVINGATQEVIFSCDAQKDESDGWFEPYWASQIYLGSVPLTEVTHWMPLPPPPKTESE